MSGPKNARGGDAFDDFFGDPTPSGRMGPAPEEPGNAPFAEDPDDEPTQDVDLRRRAEEPTQAAAPVPVITPEPTPYGAVPEDWWQPDTAPVPEVSAHSTWQTDPTPPPSPHPQPAHHPQPTYRPGPGRSLSPVAMVGMLVGGVLLGGLCVGGAVMALGGDEEPVAQSTTVTETSSPEQPSTTTPPSTTAPPSTSSTSTAPARTGKLPAGATKCAGPTRGTSVGTGSDVTSCAFAGAVREAYLAKKPKGGAVSLEVRSPVTKKSYTMKCTGAAVTRCTGGNDAVVFLY